MWRNKLRLEHSIENDAYCATKKSQFVILRGKIFFRCNLREMELSQNLPISVKVDKEIFKLSAIGRRN